MRYRTMYPSRNSTRRNSQVNSPGWRNVPRLRLGREEKTHWIYGCGYGRERYRANPRCNFYSGGRGTFSNLNVSNICGWDCANWSEWWWIALCSGSFYKIYSWTTNFISSRDSARFLHACGVYFLSTIAGELFLFLPLNKGRLIVLIKWPDVPLFSRQSRFFIFRPGFFRILFRTLICPKFRQTISVYPGSK